jgi:NAD(P)-dependent dehydrogenase (short-subunit alcohol dehydrogenase family)
MISLAEIFSVNDDVAIVSGGHTGLGKVMAEALLEAGAHVAVCSRRPEKWEESFAELKSTASQYNRQLLSFKCDVTNKAQVAEMVSAAHSKLGSVDILVNNAGVAWVAPADHMTLEDWKKVLDSNLTGTFILSQEVGRHMISKRKGKIINMTSIAALRGTPPEILDALAYSAAKAGVIGLTRDLAVKWSAHNVTVNAIAAGWFPTHMTRLLLAAKGEELASRTPLGRLGQPSDLKGVVVFLSSPASDYITGQVIVVDGGLSASF